MKYIRQLVGSRFFSAKFIKKDGSERIMICCFNIESLIKRTDILGTEITQEHIDALDSKTIPSELLPEINKKISDLGYVVDNSKGFKVIKKGKLWRKDISDKHYLFIKNKGGKILFLLSRNPTVDPKKNLIVRDTKINEIRSIPVERLQWLKFCGIKWSKNPEGNFVPDDESKIIKEENFDTATV